MARLTASNSQRIAKSFAKAAVRKLTGSHKNKTKTFRKYVSDSNRGLWRGK